MELYLNMINSIAVKYKLNITFMDFPLSFKSTIYSYLTDPNSVY